MRDYFKIWALSGLLILMMASVAVAQAAQVTGTVTYRERIAVPPEAVLRVQLVDVSRADAPSIPLSMRRYALTKVPFDFSLAYDPSLIEDRNRYAVEATVFMGERMIYRSAQVNSVLTRNAPDKVDIVVQKIAENPIQSIKQGTDFQNTVWTVIEVQGQAVMASKPPTLTFGSAGQMSVFGGCNRFSGQATWTSDGLSFSDNMAGTMMACPEPVSALEQKVLEAVQAVTGYEVGLEAMDLTNASGQVVLRLQRP